MSSTNPVVLAMRRIYCCTGAGFASWELEAGWKEIERLEAKLERYEQVLQSIADEEETLGWVYAARMAKAVLLKGEQDG